MIRTGQELDRVAVQHRYRVDTRKVGRMGAIALNTSTEGGIRQADVVVEDKQDF